MNATFTATYAPALDTPALARHELEGWLPDSLGDSDRGALRLLVSELVTNSVRHVTGSKQPVELAVRIARARSASRSTTAARASSRRAKPEPRGADGGFGLFLVERMASRWGVDTRRRDARLVRARPGDRRALTRWRRCGGRAWLVLGLAAVAALAVVDVAHRRRRVRAQPLPAAGARDRDPRAPARTSPSSAPSPWRSRSSARIWNDTGGHGAAARHGRSPARRSRSGARASARPRSPPAPRSRPSAASCGCSPTRRGSPTAPPTSTRRCGGWSTCSCPTSPTRPGSTCSQPGGGVRRLAARVDGPDRRGARGVAAGARLDSPRRPLPHDAARCAARAASSPSSTSGCASALEPRRRRPRADGALRPALDDGAAAGAERRAARRARARRRALRPALRRRRAGVRGAAGRPRRPRARQRAARQPADGDAAAAGRHPRLARRGGHRPRRATAASSTPTRRRRGCSGCRTCTRC